MSAPKAEDRLDLELPNNNANGALDDLTQWERSNRYIQITGPRRPTHCSSTRPGAGFRGYVIRRSVNYAGIRAEISKLRSPRCTGQYHRPGTGPVPFQHPIRAVQDLHGYLNTTDDGNRIHHVYLVPNISLLVSGYLGSNLDIDPQILALLPRGGPDGFSRLERLQLPWQTMGAVFNTQRMRFQELFTGRFPCGWQMGKGMTGLVSSSHPSDVSTAPRHSSV